MILEGVLCIMRYIKDVVDLMSKAKYIENPSFDAYLIKKTSDDVGFVDEGETCRIYILHHCLNSLN